MLSWSSSRRGEVSIPGTLSENPGKDTRVVGTGDGSCKTGAGYRGRGVGCSGRVFGRRKRVGGVVGSIEDPCQDWDRVAKGCW